MTENSRREIESLSDIELIKEISKREAWAFSILYDRFWPRLYGLSKRMLRDQATVEDVLQDVFTTIWRNADRFDPSRGDLLTWLLVLCRNRCIDKIRSVHKRRDRFTRIDEQEFDQLADHSSENPFEATNHRELQRKVTSALDQIPPDQRKLIELAYFGGRAQSEIARDLGLPLGTVKTRIRLGMQKLKSILKP